jgi:hypothetical protein
MKVLHHFSQGLECLLEEAVERMVTGVSHREKKAKRRRKWKGADGGTTLFHPGLECVLEELVERHVESS